MFDMLLWFAVVMVLFAVGDVVAKLTKARISSMFATLMLFLILFVARRIARRHHRKGRSQRRFQLERANAALRHGVHD